MIKKLMARPLRIEYPGAFYHITSRGNEQKDIFKDVEDREKFLFYLESSVQRYSAVIHVYCLMSNHYHLLLETPSGNLSQIMHHINGAYTTYFNKRHQRYGHLFQGRYKAIIIDADEYAAELSRYIHLNPVRAGIVKRPEEYKWSSYQYYTGRKKKPDWLRVDFILSYLGKEIPTAQKRYNEFIKAELGREHESPLREVVASTILGGEDFIKEIKDKYLEGKKADRNLPALAELTMEPTIEEIFNEVKEVFGEDTGLSKKATIFLSHRYSRMSLREIGRYFNIGESAVTQASRRFKETIDNNRALRKRINDISKRLNLSNM
jgi:REP element-mobilizing transposase RayT